MKYSDFKRLFLALIFIIFFFSFIFAPSEEKFADHLVRILDVRPGLIIADIGAGKGKFTFRLAREVSPGGHVYANEIKRPLIHRIEKGKKKHGLKNITTVQGKEKDPLLLVKADLILLKYVYHHLAHPHEFMKRTRKYLKPGGRLAVVAGDIHSRSRYKHGQKPEDPCISDPAKTRAEIERAGYLFVKKDTLEGKRVLNYVLIFKSKN